MTLGGSQMCCWKLTFHAQISFFTFSTFSLKHLLLLSCSLVFDQTSKLSFINYVAQLKLKKQNFDFKKF